MRVRLAVVLGVLLVGLFVALTIPLVQSYAEERSQRLHTARLNDATRFAVLAETVLQTGDLVAFQERIERFDDVYGVQILVYDIDRERVASSRPRNQLMSASLSSAVTAALASRVPDRSPTAWPWDDDPYVVALPVGRDSQVLGAVVTVSDTADVREDIVQRMLLLGALLVVLLVVAFLAARAMARWLLRPVFALDHATTGISQGRYATRVSPSSGPPELRGLSRSFNHMADEVVASLEREKAFVADASHQLRTPLASVRLHVENLESHVDPDGMPHWQFAVADAKRLSDLVGSLLTLANADSGDIPGVREPCDVSATTEEVLAAVRASHPDSEIMTQIQPGVVAMTPPELFASTLETLMDNAIRYGERSLIVVTLVGEADEAWLEVRDHGPGVHAGDLGRVGTRFFRSQAHQNLPGTGLGLAISRTLVERVGGRLEVSAPPGGGLSVSLRLPREQATATP